MAAFDLNVSAHLSLMEVDDEIFRLGIELVENGLHEESDYALPYPGYVGAAYLFLEVITPDRSVNPPLKGSLRLLEHRMMKDRKPPLITEEVLSYTRMHYMGKDVNLHPSHIEYGQKSKRGELCGVKNIICAVVIPGRGVITFET